MGYITYCFEKPCLSLQDSWILFVHHLRFFSFILKTHFHPCAVALSGGFRAFLLNSINFQGFFLNDINYLPSWGVTWVLISTHSMAWASRTSAQLVRKSNQISPCNGGESEVTYAHVKTNLLCSNLVRKLQRVTTQIHFHLLKTKNSS